MDHAGRRSRAAYRVADLGLDFLLVTSLVHVRYLTGFTGSNGALLLAADGVATFATDFRYVEQSARELPDVSLLVDRRSTAPLVHAAVAGADGGRVRLGFEAEHLSVAEHADLALTVPTADLVGTRGLVEELRRVKDEDEIAALREACAVGDRALADLLPALRPGVTEVEVGHALEDLMRTHGAEAPAFDPIVASGPNGALPHHRPGPRPLEPGDLLTLDFGARVAGYHADMTRTVAVGEPAGWQRDLYDLVAAAQRAGRHALAPGLALADLDAAARSVVEAAGYGPQFGHGLGHGVGLEIHEAPMVGPGAAGTLDAGSPVTVEPGVYLPGRGGVRIEDTLVVRDGGAELLTTSSKELLVVG
jgi:Xaa-Pro aminopeptidase